MPFFDRLCGWADALTRRVAWLGLALLACAVLVTVLDVLTRRTIGWSVPGLVDITQLFVMGFVYLSIPYAFTCEANVSVEFVTDAIPARPLALIKALGAAAATAFMVALTWYCLFRAGQELENGAASQTIGIPFTWYWASLLAGFTLGILASLLQALRYLRYWLFGIGSAASGQAAQV